MKCFALLLLSLALLAGVLIWLLGQSTVPDAFIADYTLSEDGSTLRFSVGVASSMGYVRCYQDWIGGHEHYLTFYSAWGGFNSRWGAQSEYILPLSPNDTAIYIRRRKAYQLVLEKDEDGNWQRVE